MNESSPARQPRRLRIVLLVSFCFTIASFVASSWLSDARAHGILGAAEKIVADAVPAISHLANARTALRQLEITLDDRVDGEKAPSPHGAAVEEDRKMLEREWKSYLAFPPFPGERDLWPAVVSETAGMDVSINRVLARLGEHDRPGAERILAEEAEPAFNRLDRRLHALVDLNAGHAAEFGRKVVALRRASRRWMVGLDAMSAIFAIIAGLTPPYSPTRVASSHVS
jgi:hypothetical protein